MKNISVIFVLICNVFVGFGCTMICSYPNTLDNSIYFLEGVVVGYDSYQRNFNRQGREIALKEYGIAQIRITKSYHSPKKVKEVNLIPVRSDGYCGRTGLSLESLGNLYKMGDTITFASPVSGLVNSPVVNLEFGVCYIDNMFYNGSLLGLSEHKIEMNRRLKSQYEKEQKILYDVPNSVQYSKDWEKRKFEMDSTYLAKRQSYEKVIPEGLQFYLNLKKAKRKIFNFKRMKLFQSIVWSNYFQDFESFAKSYGIGKKRKERLLKSFQDLKSERK